MIVVVVAVVVIALLILVIGIVLVRLIVIVIQAKPPMNVFRIKLREDSRAAPCVQRAHSWLTAALCESIPRSYGPTHI